MYYLQVKELAYRYHTRQIIDGVDFSIQKGQKIALIARNGMGKTTLLNIIAGKLECTHGEVARNKACRVWFLEQKTELADTMIVQDWFEQHEVDDEHYHDREHGVRLDKITRELDIRELLTQAWGTLSGGEQKKVALAKILIDEPDVLILDEPTNHLDLDMINWLEDYLSQKNLTLLMVTHDRYFLERVCTDIVELDRGKLYTYAGNYSDYLLKKSERLQKEHKDMHNLKQLYRRELAWVKKAPRARETKSVKRTKDFFELQGEFKTKATDYRDINKKIEITAVDKSEQRMLGNKILIMKSIVKDFGDKKILSDFSHEFRFGERIGILGRNGVGKTTFLNIVVGEEECDKGKRELSEHVEFGYYAQKIVFPPHVKVLEYAKSVADWMTIGKEKISTTKLLERFLFSPAQQQQWIHDLSGGEQRRLSLLVTLMRKPNFLILDEPTNDLDIDTMNALEDFLLWYEWCLVVISHDRYFMDKIADRIFSFEGEGKVEDFQGSYSRYVEWKLKNEQWKNNNEQSLPVIPMHEASEDGTTTLPPKKWLTKDEKKELERLMKQIAKGEERKHEINTIFQTQQLSHQELKELGKELQTLSADLEEKEMRRMELSEFVS